jgi:monofunctional biosynthetic peptidoglycan transglycosylase
LARAHKPQKRKQPPRRRRFFRSLLLLVVVLFGVYYTVVTGLLLLLRWVNPPTTAVQAERRIASWFQRQPYTKRYHFIALNHISPNLQHAVIAAEDARFFQHHGFDWEAIREAAAEDIEEHRERGASTITQQLVRNLFLSTNRSVLRKALEFSIVPVTEAVLSKRRILELYVNVIEFGRGVFGAEAASRIYFGVPAAQLSALQAAELASVLPSPLHRNPTRMTAYTRRILVRMGRTDW